VWCCYAAVTKYIPDVRDKTKLTQDLVKQLPPEQKINVDEAMRTWWFNLRKRGGMRLTGTGFVALTKDLDLENYEYQINDPMSFTQHTILDLDRKMQMPYYIHAVKGIPKKIVLFGSREAVMVNLYGNLKQFLDNYHI
jgi:hypothetical protein